MPRVGEQDNGERAPMRIAVVTLAKGKADIEAALEAGARLSALQELQNDWPPLYQSPIIYQRETDTHGGHREERFLTRALIERLGWGDCDDLCIARVGELRATGEDPGARAIAYEQRAGSGRWHIVVRRSSGEIEDPSANLGMFERLPRPPFPRVR